MRVVFISISNYQFQEKKDTNHKLTLFQVWLRPFCSLGLSSPDWWKQAQGRPLAHPCWEPIRGNFGPVSWGRGGLMEEKCFFDAKEGCYKYPEYNNIIYGICDNVPWYCFLFFLSFSRWRHRKMKKSCRKQCQTWMAKESSDTQLREKDVDTKT